MPTVPLPTGHRLGGGLLSDPESLDENGHLASESATTCVLLDMPLDCMMEILLYLGPEELLRLARLCKPLRSFLMTKSSRSIWKQGFLNLEGPVLPPCPPGLSEVQYAHLAFSNYCQECLRITYLPTDWDLRVRYCSMCEVMNTTEFDSDNPQRLPCHPTVDIQKLLAIRPPTFRPAFLNTDLIAVTAVYEQMDAQERKAYRNSRNRMLIDARIHARECRAWDAQRAKLARAAAKARRNQTVRDNLCALGWSAEVDKLHDSELDHCFEFGNYEPLTEAGANNIQSLSIHEFADQLSMQPG
ncbi:hypothetical protein B0H11DRAFT_2069029 [Mycena galericulata]|nr:hypothetical protein B0H11DRAFT_2069029 [Mycena galericulata]